MLKQIIVGSILGLAFTTSLHAEQTFSQPTSITKGTIVSGTIKRATLKTVVGSFAIDTVLSGGTISAGNVDSGAINGGSIDDKAVNTTDKAKPTVSEVKNASLVGAKISSAVVSGIINNDTGTVEIGNATPVALENVELLNAHITGATVPVDGISTGSPSAKDNIAPKSSDFFTQGAWGAGLGLLWNEQPVVSDATIVNNTVRADTIQRSQPELVLTRHYYNADGATCKGFGSYSRGALNVLDQNSCVGGFIAVGISSSSQLIDMFGVGILFGFGKVHEKGTDGQLHENTQLRQHNFGIGFGRRFGVKQLGDGFSNNAPPPTGETQIRYKTIDTPILFLMYSYTLTSM